MTAEIALPGQVSPEVERAARRLRGMVSRYVAVIEHQRVQAWRERAAAEPTPIFDELVREFRARHGEQA